MPLLVFILLVLVPSMVDGQVILRGRITDCRTGQPLAFVNLISADRTHGTSTGIEGNFSMEVSGLPLQISATYVGYEALHQWVTQAGTILKLEMCPRVLVLSEVVIMPWDNPALAIVRKVSANRRKHDPARLDGYTCTAYGKMIFTADTSRLANNRVQVPDTTMAKIRAFMKEQYFFLMETVSERTYGRGRLHEKVIGSRVSGFHDPMFVFLISQIQSFSFYEDLIRISDKSYVNPVSPAGLRKYFFSLEDTLYQETDTVYVIRFNPMPGSRIDAMQGLLYINTDGWAVQNVTAEPAAEQGGVSLSIRQRYTRVGQHWFPVELGTTLWMKNVLIENFAIQGEGSYYLGDIDINPTRLGRGMPRSEVELAPQATGRDASFWLQHRVTPLDQKEMRTYQVIDSIGNQLGFDLLSKRLDALTRGRFPIGPLELDLQKLTRYNLYEKGYFGVGLWSGQRSLPGLEVGAWAGYGIFDRAWKYGGAIRANLYRPYDVQVFAMVSDDLREQGQVWAPRRPGQSSLTDFRYLFIDRMDRLITYQLGMQFRPLADLSCSVSLEREQLTYGSPYRYAVSGSGVTVWPDHGAMNLATMEMRYAHKERILDGFGSRLSYGSAYPVIGLKMRRSFEAPTGARNPVTAIEMQIETRHAFPLLGVSNLTLAGGMATPGSPAPYLYYGKAGFRFLSFHSPSSFATMRMNEFLSDRFLSLFFYHDFKRLLTGRKYAPSIQLHFNAGWGSISETSVHQGISFQTMEKVYLESGLLIPDVISIGLATLGAGIFYRFGPYRLPGQVENLSFKIALGVPF